MHQLRDGFRRLLVPGLAVLGLLTLPAVAIAVSQNVVIRSGNVQGAKVLENSRRYTLYVGMRDNHGKSTCYGYCANSWKPVLTKQKGIALRGSGVNQRMLGTTRRKNGQLQVTYNHHPLYTYVGDTGPGQDGGQECIDTSGHYWFMINTHGKPVTNIVGCEGY